MFFREIAMKNESGCNIMMAEASQLGYLINLGYRFKTKQASA